MGKVLVDQGALAMVLNALRRDAEEGRAVRGEMADALAATVSPLEDRQPDGYVRCEHAPVPRCEFLPARPGMAITGSMRPVLFMTPNVELSGPEAALSPEGPARTQGYASRLRKPLDVVQRATLGMQLKRDDLQIFTVVRMAQKDLAKGDYDMALSRLRMDADKLRDEKELYAIIRYYFD